MMISNMNGGSCEYVNCDKYGYLKGFEIAGNDQVFYFAKAQIENNKVVIYNENM